MKLALLIVGAWLCQGNAGDFSSNYVESRGEFRKVCTSLGGKCSSYKLEHTQDSDLTIDTAYFSRQGPNLLVLQSGIHGPELYAGSAAQQLFLQRYLNSYLDHGIDVLLVHALNPFGAKYDRRSNEDNVNLNRGFADDFQIANSGYKDFRSLFEPQGKVDWVGGESLWIQLHFVSALIRLGFDRRALSQAFNSGQYDSPQGINYGGRALSQEARILSDVLKPLMREHSGRTLFLDFHTGLGASGVLQIMNGIQPNRELLSKFVRVMTGKTGVELVDPTRIENAHVYTTQGDVIDYIPRLSPRPDEVLALTLEYGTLGQDVRNQLRSVSRMILENQAHTFGCSEDASCAEVRSDFRALFAPQDESWQGKVLAEAREVFASLPEYFSLVTAK